MMALDWRQLLGSAVSFDVGLKLDTILAVTASSASAGLAVFACLLFLAGFALIERASARSGLVIRPSR